MKIIIHTIHGFPFHPYQSPLVRKFYENLERLAGIFCDQAVSVNVFERDLAVEKHLINRNKIMTICNGILGLESHNPITREALGLEKEKVIVGSVSRFSEQKNIINLINVAVEVVKQAENIVFVFIGDGEYFEETQDIIHKAGVTQNIKLVGWQSNVEDWYDLFDIVILYSKWEGLSLTLLEAMSMKKPLIASNIKGNNELIIDGINGYLVDINNHQELTKKIISLSKDTLTQKKFGEAGYKIFLESYTLDTFVSSYEQLYQRLIEKKYD